MRLTKTMKIFCHEYIKDYHGTDAAIRAGYTAKSAYSQASKLLARYDIKDYIDKLEAKMWKRHEKTADDVIDQFKKIAFNDITDYYETRYKIQNVYDMDGAKNKHNSRKKRRLERIHGYDISETQYNSLSDKSQRFYDPYERLKEMKQLTKQQRVAIQGITYDRHGNKVLKLSNKENSLDALAKHFGIYEKDNSQKSLHVRVENRTIDDFYKDAEK